MLLRDCLKLTRLMLALTYVVGGLPATSVHAIIEDIPDESEFKTAVDDALAVIFTTQIGKDVVNELKSAPELRFRIVPCTLGDCGSQIARYATSRTIYWTSAPTDEQLQRLSSSEEASFNSTVILFHELFHAYDDLQKRLFFPRGAIPAKGTCVKRRDRVKCSLHAENAVERRLLRSECTGCIQTAELDAVRSENEFRRQLKLDLDGDGVIDLRREYDGRVLPEYREAGLCTPGDLRPCYDGQPPDTRDVGECHGGTQVCDETGLGFKQCEGDRGPLVSEICGDGFDQNCNGEDATCPPIGSVTLRHVPFDDHEGGFHPHVRDPETGASIRDILIDTGVSTTSTLLVTPAGGFTDDVIVRVTNIDRDDALPYDEPDGGPDLTNRFIYFFDNTLIDPNTSSPEITISYDATEGAYPAVRFRMFFPTPRTDGRYWITVEAVSASDPSIKAETILLLVVGLGTPGSREI